MGQRRIYQHCSRQLRALRHPLRHLRHPRDIFTHNAHRVEVFGGEGSFDYAPVWSRETRMLVATQTILGNAFHTWNDNIQITLWFYVKFIPLIVEI